MGTPGLGRSVPSGAEEGLEACGHPGVEGMVGPASVPRADGGEWAAAENPQL